MTMFKAYSDARGVIGFTWGRTPKGMCTFYRGRDEDKVRAEIEVTARHAYQKGVLLVPGVPEAANEAEGMTALIRHREWLNQRRAKRARA